MVDYNSTLIITEIYNAVIYVFTRLLPTKLLRATAVKTYSALNAGGDLCFIPLSPKSDQHEISPCNINAF